MNIHPANKAAERERVGWGGGTAAAAAAAAAVVMVIVGVLLVGNRMVLRPIVYSPSDLFAFFLTV